MSKISITEKLNYKESPRLEIGDVVVCVNNDAATMLKVMQLVGGEVGPADIVSLYELLFTKEERKKIESLKLNFEDFQTVLKAAISAVTGQDMDNANEKE